MATTEQKLPITWLDYSGTDGSDPLSEGEAPREKKYFVFDAIKYNPIWDFYKQAEGSFWTVSEVDLSRDMTDWNKLDTHEKHFLKNVLGFFSGADSIVIDNLAVRFLKDIRIFEVNCFYTMQMTIENIHTQMYGLLIQTYISDETERACLFSSIDRSPEIKKKADWALKWIGNNDHEGSDESYHSASLGMRLVAFIAVEGIFFSSSFCSIFWLKKRGLMPGLCFSNELISVDEALHTKFGIHLHTHLPSEYKASKDSIIQIISEAVLIEESFARDSLQVDLIGMNSTQMIKYIHTVADKLLVLLGLDPIYNEENPFDWMDLISIDGKTNFFERRTSDYGRVAFPIHPKAGSTDPSMDGEGLPPQLHSNYVLQSDCFN